MYDNFECFLLNSSIDDDLANLDVYDCNILVQVHELCLSILDTGTGTCNQVSLPVAKRIFCCM